MRASCRGRAGSGFSPRPSVGSALRGSLVRRFRMRVPWLLAACGAFAGPAPALGATATKLVPIVLDVTGSGEHFTTELVLTNRGTTSASVALTYTPAASVGATGGGTANVALAAGHQLVVSDVLAFLRTLGLAIPTGSNQGGTLVAAFSGLSSPDAAYAGARTTTPSGAGRAGLAYSGVDLSAALTQTSNLYGLRSDAADRSNLALVNANTSAAVTLRVTLYGGAGGPAVIRPLARHDARPPPVDADRERARPRRLRERLREGRDRLRARPLRRLRGRQRQHDERRLVRGCRAGGDARGSAAPPRPRRERPRSRASSSSRTRSPCRRRRRSRTSSRRLPASGAGGSVMLNFAAGEQKIIPGARRLPPAERGRDRAEGPDVRGSAVRHVPERRRPVERVRGRADGGSGRGNGPRRVRPLLLGRRPEPRRGLRSLGLRPPAERGEPLEPRRVEPRRRRRLHHVPGRRLRRHDRSPRGLDVAGDARAGRVDAAQRRASGLRRRERVRPRRQALRKQPLPRLRRRERRRRAGPRDVGRELRRRAGGRRRSRRSRWDPTSHCRTRTFPSSPTSTRRSSRPPRGRTSTSSSRPLRRTRRTSRARSPSRRPTSGRSPSQPATRRP